MAAITQERKMEKSFSFEPRALRSSDPKPRLGTLSCQGRAAINTPHYVALTSRGTVPHLTQDMMRDNTAIKGIYTALEDCEYRAMGCITADVLIGMLLPELASHRESP